MCGSQFLKFVRQSFKLLVFEFTREGVVLAGKSVDPSISEMRIILFYMESDHQTHNHNLGTYGPFSYDSRL